MADAKSSDPASPPKKNLERAQTDTYIDELVEIFLKLSMKTVQVHLIIWTTLVYSFTRHSLRNVLLV